MLLSMVCAGLILVGQTGPMTAGEVELVADGFGFTEGPVWTPEGVLLFTDIPKNAIHRADKSVFRQPSGNANGLYIDREGRLIACEHGNRRVSRTEKDGTITTLADSYGGKKLNSPNDAVVRSDGAIFFTDPPYGIKKEEQEQPHQGVYAILPDGALKLIVSDFKKPNGIGLSPDQKTLYVADTEGDHIRAFDVAGDGTASNGRVLCPIPGPDGMAIDEQGNIWCTGEGGIHIFNPKGEKIQFLPTPQGPANCAFGDADFKTLYITARTGLYKVKCTVAGFRHGTK